MQSRFLPGTLLAERYRIVAMLGRGGMGEVYRADDLTLGQSVALKFLPEATARDEATLERFRNEVRIARRVSHPNVCRIYDIGEAEGLQFLSMEYVDGEDLGSLLRRIGRLPADKALEIARKLCAGLAAAHDKGVLHRDLKPANIMLDAEGEVVITDFGLADLAANITPEQVRYGTPAYMAPEQLAGKEVTARSDIYALGLVFYEIFTGKRAFQADTLAEIVRTRTASPTPANPSTLVPDLDPGVERVILRCLESDPAMRPASVLAVAAALPGGDPLAAALAAGETPSPQMVAAAGEVEGLATKIAVPCIAALLVALVVSYFVGVRIGGANKIHADQPPDVLTHKAKEIVRALGYPSALDSEYGFYENTDLERYIERTDKPRPNWDRILAQPPMVVGMWYLQSPETMVTTEFHNDALVPGIITPSDPAPTISGMIEVDLDPQGKLTYFQAIPPQLENKVQLAKPVDWKPLFDAAGIDPAQLKPADPIWNSLASSDTRAAWTGTWPGTTRPLRIEAAALHGQPVFFYAIGPWTQPDRQTSSEVTAGHRTALALLALLFAIIMVAAVLLARRNYLQKRGDARGAFRLATFVFFAHVALWVCNAHFVPTLGSFGLFIIEICAGLFVAIFIAVLYLALEPLVRRRWPQSIISWSRLLLRRWRDPLVGRDVLFGLLIGLLWVLIFQARIAITQHLGDVPAFGAAEYLHGARYVLGRILNEVPEDIRGTLTFFFVLFLLRVVLRKAWLAAIAFVAIWTAQQVVRSNYPYIDTVTWALIYGCIAFAAVRFGLISLGVGLACIDILLNVPWTADLSSWFIGAPIFAYACIAALGIWAFYTALAGRKLWKGELFE